MTLWEQNAGQNHSIKIAIKPFESLERFKCSGTILSNQNCIHVQIRSRLNSGDACYHSVQNLLYYSFLSTDIKIKICTNINLSVVVYGCETWSA
jgi:hypothetical protein